MLLHVIACLPACRSSCLSWEGGCDASWDVEGRGPYKDCTFGAPAERLVVVL